MNSAIGDSGGGTATTPESPFDAPRAHRPLRVLSFDTVLGVSGITTWNLRMAGAFLDRPELGIEWTAVEVGERAEFGRVIAGVPGGARGRVSFVAAAWDENVYSVFRRAYAGNPAWRGADVVLPNGVMQGWLLPERVQRERGVAARPAAVGGIHNDMDIAYDMSGRGATRVEGVFAVSRHCQREFARRYPDRPAAAFVPYGVPVAAEAPAKPRAGPLTLVYCGRVVRAQKRVMDLVPLAAELARRGVDFVLHVVGDGPELPGLRGALASAAGPRAVLHGAMRPEEVLPFLADKHVLVSVSEHEGTSISMLEAMGQGLAPVVTDIASGVRDAIEVGVSGLVAPVGDGATMAGHVERLARDRAVLASLGAAAHRAARDGYSLDASAARMAELLHAAASGPPRGEYHVSPDHPILRDRRMDRPWVPNVLLRGLRRLRAATRRGAGGGGGGNASKER